MVHPMECWNEMQLDETGFHSWDDVMEVDHRVLVHRGAVALDLVQSREEGEGLENWIAFELSAQRKDHTLHDHKSEQGEASLHVCGQTKVVGLARENNHHEIDQLGFSVMISTVVRASLTARTVPVPHDGEGVDHHSHMILCNQIVHVVYFSFGAHVPNPMAEFRVILGTLNHAHFLPVTRERGDGHRTHIRSRGVLGVEGDESQEHG